MKTVVGTTVASLHSVAAEMCLLDVTLATPRECRCGDDRLRSQFVEEGKLQHDSSCTGPVLCDYQSLHEAIAEATMFECSMVP